MTKQRRYRDAPDEYDVRGSPAYALRTVRAKFVRLGGRQPRVNGACLIPRGRLLTSHCLPPRVLARSKQYVVQAALGAGRFELAKGLLAESLMLALAGGAAGALIALAAVQGFQALLPDSLPMWMRIEVDVSVLLFCFAATVATGLAFGFAPAIVGSCTNLNDALKDGARGSSGGSNGRSVLVVSEVALSLLLLLGAGLLMKTFLQMQMADHGFEAGNLIVANVRNNSFSKADRAERAGLLAAYHQRILEGLQALPGVESAAVTNALPYSGSELRNGRLRIQGRAEEETQFLLPIAGADVSWDYFETMGIPLLAGRFFERTDRSDGAPVVILNEVGAKALFGDENPVGRMVQWGDTVGPANPYCRVVGVVGDVKHGGAERDAIELYYPFTQWPVGGGYYVLQTSLDRAGAASLVRAAIQSSDPNAAVVWIKSMTERIDEALWQQRLWGVLFTVFGVLAILLAAVAAAHGATTPNSANDVSRSTQVHAQAKSVGGLSLSAATAPDRTFLKRNIVRHSRCAKVAPPIAP